jgi:hypothetical protein
MPQMTIELYDRRKRMLELHYSGMQTSAMINALMEDGNRESTLRVDWHRRKTWEPLIWRTEQSKEDVERLLFQLRLAREKALRLATTANNDNAKVGAIGKLGELVKLEIELRQSLGTLPKVADKLDILGKFESVNLNVTDNEDEILSKAAAILDKKLGKNRESAKESVSIH